MITAAPTPPLAQLSLYTTPGTGDVPISASATVFSLAKAHLQKSLGEELIFSQDNKWTGYLGL
jgi:hypothetical protein